MHERGGRPITLLFTDVQGSTQLRARHGDRVADEILHEHEAIVQATGEHGGAEAAFFGDGFLATFDTPAAGLGCAVAVQRASSSGTGGSIPTAASGSGSGCTTARPPSATAPSTARPSTPPRG